MPARGFFFVFLPIRTRAALGPRSTGTKTGAHGACLTAAAFLGEAGKTPVSKRRGKPDSGAEPSGGTGGECRKRERRKAGARQDQQRAAAHGADIGWTMRLSALRFPLLPEATCKESSWLRGGGQSSGADDAWRE